MLQTQLLCAGVSQGVEVRDGKVEESERSEGDDVGLRVFVGKRQAVVSTSDISGDNVAKLAERAVAMAKVAPDDDYVGLADQALLAKQFPDLDLLDPKVPSIDELERRAQEAEAAGLAVKGVLNPAAHLLLPVSAAWCLSPAPAFTAPTCVPATAFP